MFKWLKGLMQDPTPTETGEPVSLNKDTSGGPRRFAADSLHLSNLLCDVEIRGSNEPDMTVAVEGTPEAVATIEVYTENRVLHVRCKPDASYGTVNIVSSRGGGIVISGSFGGDVTVVNGRTFVNGREIIAGAPSVKPPKVTITTPLSTEIEFAGMLTHTRVRGVNCRLRGSLSGQSDVEVETATYGVIDVAGQSELVIGNFAGSDLMLRCSGQSEIEVSAGRIEKLEARASGQSDIDIDAAVQVADLTASGQSDIKLAKAVYVVRRQKSGQSGIKIKQLG